MPDQKVCQQCNQQFTIEDEDLEFYKKISPTFSGKTFEIPSPKMCSDCRRQRRLVWRNVTKLYRRKSDFSGKEIISPYPPNARNKVYDNSERWSDKWSALDYGRDFDFSRPFFEQYDELQLEVPVNSRNVILEENSDFTNNATGLKNCYLLQNANYDEDCFYGVRVNDSKDCIDNYVCTKSENCYECVNIENCYSCLFCNDSSNCRDSILLDDCSACKDCFGCTNLSNKQYYINNNQSTKEEVEKIKKDFLDADLTKRGQLIQRERRFWASQPKRFAHVLKSENSTGDYIRNSKDVFEGYLVNECENMRYCYNVFGSKDSIDYDCWGNDSSYIFESVETGLNCQRIHFSRMVDSCSNIFYSTCMYGNSHDCFGCAGLNHEEFCVFNKKYSRDEYENLVARIIEHMQKTGEWGEFFPMKYSAFCYNETVDLDFYPLTKEGAEKLGARWQDEDFSLEYTGPFYMPKPIEQYKENSDLVNEALAGVIKCRISGRPFKLQAGEMAFYIKNSIQIPDLHPDQRHIERFKLTNPLKTWHRQCYCEESGHDHESRCTNEFETSYAPDRPERVYCEKCYQSIIK